MEGNKSNAKKMAQTVVHLGWIYPTSERRPWHFQESPPQSEGLSLEEGLNG